MKFQNVSMDGFDLVYTVLDEPVSDRWQPFAWFAAFAFLTYVYLRYVSKIKRSHFEIHIWHFAGIAMGVIMLLIPLKGLYDLSEIKKRYENKEFKIVEGFVENFDPMPFQGHKRESFIVNGVKFSYTDYNDSHYAFRNTKSHGGQIDKGKYVRIGYITEDGENRIWKIEVRR